MNSGAYFLLLQPQLKSILSALFCSRRRLIYTLATSRSIQANSLLTWWHRDKHIGILTKGILRLFLEDKYYFTAVGNAP